jgi:aldehyde:ferredoxin oxidoreductase
MDTISAGVTVGFAMECFERGILDKKDTGGIDLKFGNYEAIVDTIEKIAYRKDLGNLLADGTKRFSETVNQGAEAFAMQVKGMEFAAWMPATMKGMALNFATSNRGACHKRGIIGDELRLAKVDRFSYDGKPELLKERQERVNVMFSGIFCRFSDYAYSVDQIRNLINTSSGLNLSLQEFYMVGERIWNLERIFSGYTRSDDTLPKRCYTEPIPAGPSAGLIVDQVKLEKMLDEYYEIRGWDSNGRPSKAKKEELGILRDV